MYRNPYLVLIPFKNKRLKNFNSFLELKKLLHYATNDEPSFEKILT
jgi:hypothetical protein